MKNYNTNLLSAYAIYSSELVDRSAISEVLVLKIVAASGLSLETVLDRARKMCSESPQPANVSLSIALHDIKEGITDSWHAVAILGKCNNDGGQDG